MKVTVKVSLKKPTPDRHNMLVTEILKKHKDLKKKKKKKDTAEHIFINPTAADGRCILLVVWR